MAEAIIEIRAGAGGDEAALFASDLFNMYKKYAISKGWGVEVIDSNQNTLGGYKSLVFELKGQAVFDKSRRFILYFQKKFQTFVHAHIIRPQDNAFIQIFLG